MKKITMKKPVLFLLLVAGFVLCPGNASGQQIAANRTADYSGYFWLEEFISSLDMVSRWQEGHRGLKRDAVHGIVGRVRSNNNYTQLIGKVTPSQFDVLYAIRQDYIRIYTLMGDRRLSNADVRSMLSGFNFNSRIKYLLGIRNQLRADAGYTYMRQPDDIASSINPSPGVRISPLLRKPIGW